MKLTGKQKKAFREALLAAFPTHAQFRMLLQDELDRSLDEIAMGNDLEEIVFKTIEKAEAKHWLPALIDAVGKVQSSGPLGKLSKELLASREQAAPSGSFERIIRERAPFIHIEVLLDFLERAKRRVCLIESDGGALATGFLVGPDVIMTCHHVIDDFVGTDGANLSARFDYRSADRGEKSVNAGTRHEFARPWLLASAPPGPTDHLDPDVEPDSAHLDFALLRLATPVGNETIEGEKRGWVPLLAKPPELRPNDIVCVLQHPDGEPLQMAIDSVLPQQPWRTRVRYVANTEGGSSGSPCFNLDGDFVALHHYGVKQQYNQGIPAAALRGHIERMGLEHLIGGKAGLESVSGNVAIELPLAHQHTSAPKASTDLVLLAFSGEQDQSLLSELLTHLGPLVRGKKVALWHAGMVTHGDVLGETAAQIAGARVIAVLVSASLLNSADHADLIDQALQRAKAGEAAVVPVLLSASRWKDSPLGRFAPLPRNEKYVKLWQDRDSAWLEVTQGLEAVVLSRRSRS
jgi:hypothetical protein